MSERQSLGRRREKIMDCLISLSFLCYYSPITVVRVPLCDKKRGLLLKNNAMCGGGDDAEHMQSLHQRHKRGRVGRGSNMHQ